MNKAIEQKCVERNEVDALLTYAIDRIEREGEMYQFRLCVCVCLYICLHLHFGSNH